MGRRAILLAVMLVVAITASADVGETTNGGKMSKGQFEREVRRKEYAAEVDAIVKSRNYIFRPVTMQNVVTGNTRSIFAYYLYVGVTGDRVVLHLPVEFTSYVIDTVNLDAYVEGYTADFSDGNWRITFSFLNGEERWLIEIFLSDITGQTRLALVTPKGVMRYLGTLESGATIRRKNRLK